MTNLHFLFTQLKPILFLMNPEWITKEVKFGKSMIYFLQERQDYMLNLDYKLY